MDLLHYKKPPSTKEHFKEFAMLLTCAWHGFFSDAQDHLTRIASRRKPLTSGQAEGFFFPFWPQVFVARRQKKRKKGE